MTEIEMIELVKSQLENGEIEECCAEGETWTQVEMFILDNKKCMNLLRQVTKHVGDSSEIDKAYILSKVGLVIAFFADKQLTELTPQLDQSHAELPHTFPVPQQPQGE